MKYYFGHKREIKHPFDMHTQQMMHGKSPLIRSQIYNQRWRLKLHLVKTGQFR